MSADVLRFFPWSDLGKICIMFFFQERPRIHNPSSILSQEQPFIDNTCLMPSRNNHIIHHSLCR